jgi:DNA-binding transcriptional MerR regulator
MASKLISISDVAKKLRVCANTLVRWDKIGKLKAVKIGNHQARWYRAIDIYNFINGSEEHEKKIDL